MWLYCNYCEIRGNLISFAAEIWHTTVKKTIARFVENGVVTEEAAARNGEDYVKTHAGQNYCRDFWELVAGQLWSHCDDVLACKLRELGLRHETKLGDGLVGVADPAQLAEFCGAIGRRKPQTIINAKTPTLVFPYYDLPGRFSGFLIKQYAEDLTERAVFLSAHGTNAKTDAGYFLLNKLLAPASDVYRGKQFVVNDPEWALTAHCFWGVNNDKTLPIVSDYADTTGIKSMGRQWASLFPATRCFQNEQITPHVISQACLARGYVSIVPLNNKRMRGVNQQYFLNRLVKIYAAASTWQKTLLKVLTAVSETAAYTFAVGLTIPHEKLQQFFNNAAQSFSPHFTFRVLENLKYGPTTAVKAFGKMHVVLRDGKWWSASGNLVCNAQIVITKILQLDNAERVYVGKIFSENATLDFTVPGRVVDRQGLLAFAASHAANYGVLVNFSPRWNARSLLAALELHPPKIERLKTELGWDAESDMFYMGDYAIQSDGKCVQVVDPQSGLIDKSFKPIDIVPPTAISELFTPTERNNFIWAIFGSICANAFAPIARVDSRATALDATGFELAKTIGAALLCDHKETTAVRKTNSSIFLKKQIAENDWPIFVSNAFDDSLFSSAVPRSFNASVFVRVNRTVAAVAPSYGWQTICGAVGQLTEKEASAVQKLFSQYVQHTLTTRLKFNVVRNDDFTALVLADLSAWLQKIYGNTFSVKNALQQIKKPAQAHETLFAEIGMAVAAGELTVIPRPRRPDQPTDYLLCRRATWWINRKAVDNICKTGKNIYPNWLAVIKLLTDNGLFIAEETVNKLPGFVVEKSWCDNFLLVNHENDAKFAG